MSDPIDHASEHAAATLQAEEIRYWWHRRGYDMPVTVESVQTRNGGSMWSPRINAVIAAQPGMKRGGEPDLRQQKSKVRRKAR